MKRVERPNYTQIPNDILGDILKGNTIEPGLMAELEGSQLKVLLAVYRFTLGYHKTERRASITMIEKMTGLSRQGVFNAAEKLEEYELIEREQDGGVTLWRAVVNSVDQVVNSVDQVVNSVDQQEAESGQLSRPPSRKEINKKKEENKDSLPGKNANGASTAKDVLQDILEYTEKGVSEVTAPNPEDQYWKYRDPALAIAAKYLSPPNQVEKDDIIALVEQPGFSPKKWDDSVKETARRYRGQGKITRAIEIYQAGGTWAKWQEKTFQQEIPIKPKEKIVIKAI